MCQMLNTSDLNMSNGKMSYFVSVPLFTLIFLMKLKDFDFTTNCNTLLFFDLKKDLSLSC